MKPKFYTVMVVPHQGRRTRAFVVSRPFLASIGVLGAILAVGGVLFPHLYLSSLSREGRLGTLREQNRQLNASVHSVGRQVTDLRGRLDYYEGQARKFAMLAGLDELPEPMQAAGGAVPGMRAGDRVLDNTASVREEMDALNSREASLTRNFEALDIAWEERRAYLESMPSLAPTEVGYLGSRYGWRKDPFSGRRVFHRGQDIVAYTGTEVYAPAAGKVIRAGRIGGLGLAVYISHGHGFVTRYGHLSKISVKRGQKIKRGNRIGKVGSTGRSMGSHLHYEVLVHGKHRNPRDFMLQDAGAPLS